MTDVELFLRYIDDIVRTVKGEPSVILHAANKLHPNLQFTLETPKESGELAFLDNNINLDGNRQVKCRWYQKLMDTGTLLNFRNCAPLHYKRNTVECTVHRIFRRTSTWKLYHKAM